MKAFIFYFLELVVISGSLYGYYHFFLKNKKFHRYNRFYLLLLVLFSILVPLLHIPVFVSEEVANSSLVANTLTNLSITTNLPLKDIPATIVETPSSFDWNLLAKYIYLVIAFGGMIRVFYGIYLLARLKQKNQEKKIGKIVFINTSEQGTPFSFFRWLFWNSEIKTDSPEGKQIFRHELFHIKQKHSADIVLMELLNAVAWVNPVFSLVKKELRVIHEFLADEYAVEDHDSSDYAELLLMQTLHTKHPLTNPFFHNHVKRRIMVLMFSKKPAYQYLRKMLVLPMALFLFGLFAFNYKKIENAVAYKSSQGNVIKNFSVSQTVFKKEVNNPFTFQAIKSIDTVGKPLVILDNIQQKANSVDEILKKIVVQDIESINVLKGDAAIKKYGEKAKDGAIEIVTKKTLTSNANPDSRLQIIFDKVEIPASFPGGEEAFKRYISSKFPVAAESSIRGKVKYWFDVSFIVDTNGHLLNVMTIDNDNSYYAQQAVQLIRKGPPWIPAIQNGHVVNSRVVQHIEFYTELQSKYDESTVPYTSVIDKHEISAKDLRSYTVNQLLRIPENSEIISYVFTIDNDKDIIQIANTGNKFSQATLDVLNSIIDNRLITIDNIRIRENDREKKIPSRIWFVTK
jgi:beta-lactamase regulating signal transducer with metallopeptidase domain